MMKKIYTLLFLMVTCTCFAQDDLAKPPQYIIVGTGLTWDSYYSFGPRLNVEYIRKIKNQERYYWSISVDSKWPGLSGIPSVKLAPGVPYPPALSTNNISLNLHSFLIPTKSFFNWDFSCGMGAMYAHGEGKHGWQPTLSAGMAMDIRIAKGTYIETARLYILPPTKFTVSTSPLYNYHKKYVQASFIPIGLKIKL
jgi:hypothetical protein